MATLSLLPIKSQVTKFFDHKSALVGTHNLSTTLIAKESDEVVSVGRGMKKLFTIQTFFQTIMQSLRR